jgi:prohibitin 2
VTKAVVAQYNASELLTKRELVSRQIREMLIRRSADFHILLDDVAITHLAFSKEYTAAVEAKQVAQQDAERAKYIVERAIQEKKSIVIRAEGEAKSAELIGNVRTGVLDDVWDWSTSKAYSDKARCYCSAALI